MNAQFERRLNDLMLLARDWRTNIIFTAEAQKMTNELSAMTFMNADSKELMECVAGLKRIITTQEKWLQDQLSAVLDPMAGHTTAVRWVLQ
ncbi:MAG: hypothetical protein KA113_15460 [Syntrophaceae bacterium]|nr:hypothetical protein [Syntrophaceae bacterium]